MNYMYALGILLISLVTILLLSFSYYYYTKDDIIKSKKNITARLIDYNTEMKNYKWFNSLTHKHYTYNLNKLEDDQYILAEWNGTGYGYISINVYDSDMNALSDGFCTNSEGEKGIIIGKNLAGCVAIKEKLRYTNAFNILHFNSIECDNYKIIIETEASRGDIEITKSTVITTHQKLEPVLPITNHISTIENETRILPKINYVNSISRDIHDTGITLNEENVNISEKIGHEILLGGDNNNTTFLDNTTILTRINKVEPSYCYMFDHKVSDNSIYNEVFVCDLNGYKLRSWNYEDCEKIDDNLYKFEITRDMIDNWGDRVNGIYEMTKIGNKNNPNIIHKKNYNLISIPKIKVT